MRSRPTRFALAAIAVAALWLMGADGDVPLFALASVLTIQGAAITAALITGTIEVFKRTFPVIGARHWEQAIALVLSILFVIMAEADAIQRGTAVLGLPALFSAIVAWLAIAKLATGIHDEFTAAPGSFREAQA